MSNFICDTSDTANRLAGDEGKNAVVFQVNCDLCGEQHNAPLCDEMCPFCMERQTGGGICGPCAGFTEDGQLLDEVEETCDFCRYPIENGVCECGRRYEESCRR